MNPKFLLNICLFLSAVFSLNASAIVDISGTLDGVYHDRRDGTIRPVHKSTFHILRDGKGWQMFINKQIMATNIPKEMLSRAITNFAIASDGKTVFFVDGPSNANIGKIIPHALPFGDVEQSIPWWFFILERDNIASLQDLPVPWELPGSDPRAYFCTQEISWSQNKPSLISNVKFFYSSNRVMRAWDSPLRFNDSHYMKRDQALKQAALAFEQQHRLAGECSVSIWTNTPLGFFPLEFNVEVYDELAFFNPNNPDRLWRQYFGKVSSIAEATNISYVPPLEYPLFTVYDLRFYNRSNNVHGVRYANMKSWPTNMADVSMANAIPLKTGPPPPPKIFGVSHNTLLALLMVFACLVAVCFSFKYQS